MENPTKNNYKTSLKTSFRQNKSEIDTNNSHEEPSTENFESSSSGYNKLELKNSFSHRKPEQDTHQAINENSEFFFQTLDEDKIKKYALISIIAIVAAFIIGKMFKGKDNQYTNTSYEYINEMETGAYYDTASLSTSKFSNSQYESQPTAETSTEETFSDEEIEAQSDLEFYESQKETYSITPGMKAQDAAKIPGISWFFYPSGMHGATISAYYDGKYYETTATYDGRAGSADFSEDAVKMLDEYWGSKPESPFYLRPDQIDSDVVFK